MDNRFFKQAVAGAVMLAAFVQPAQAGSGCWDSAAANAVKVKDLQSRLMVATLRCNAMGFDNSASYNGFVTGNKVALGASNKVVKARFEEAHGKRWQTAYDRWNTSLANAYGAGQTNAQICADTNRLAREAAGARNNPDKLLAIAERTGSDPVLPGGRCRGSSYASR